MKEGKKQIGIPRIQSPKSYIRSYKCNNLPQYITGALREGVRRPWRNCAEKAAFASANGGAKDVEKQVVCGESSVRITCRLNFLAREGKTLAEMRIVHKLCNATVNSNFKVLRVAIQVRWHAINYPLRCRVKSLSDVGEAPFTIPARNQRDQQVKSQLTMCSRWLLTTCIYCYPSPTCSPCFAPRMKRAKKLYKILFS